MRFAAITCLASVAALAGAACSNDHDVADAGSDAAPADGDTSCPVGQSYYVPGCGASGIVITPGCYTPCGLDPTTCSGTDACQVATINPCVCPAGEGCCAACGADERLCLPWDPPDTTPYELGDLDEECDHLTGQQILDIAGGAHTVPFVYASAAPETELTLTFEYAGGTITCQPPIIQPPGVGAPDLPAHVDLVVDATVSTADGAFDESGTATLQLMGLGEASVMHNFDFDAATLAGSYTPTDPTLVDRVRFGGSIFTTGLQGDALEDGHTAGGAMSTAPIGSWDTLP